MTTQISDSVIALLREVAQQLTDARTIAEEHEAIRAFLCGVQNDGVGIDAYGELVAQPNP